MIDQAGDGTMHGGASEGSLLTSKDMNAGCRSISRRTTLLELAGVCVIAGIVSASAIVTKEATGRSELSALAAVRAPATVATDSVPAELLPAQEISDPLVEAAEPGVVEVSPAALSPVSSVEPEPRVEVVVEEDRPVLPEMYPEGTRFFNGRPVRPARTLTMLVTAYSPDHRSCGDSADGITSSIHNVHTNAMRLVAADSRVLPLGSIISVPGYDEGRVVPVLDRGGAIKGNRLDVLFATHEQALKWGVQRLRVTVWEYADGKPACDYRRFRDSRN
jgi:3D (Asp-Asp-Asp) domain-containing protein